MEYAVITILALFFYGSLFYTMFIEEDPTMKAVRELLEVSDKN